MPEEPDRVLARVDGALWRHFAQRPVRASVSFVGLEPIEVLRFVPAPGERVYVSLGMSRRSMTAADAVIAEVDGPRAELLVHLHDPIDAYREIWRSLAVLAAAPVVEGVVYRTGMTVDLGSALAAGSRCSGVLVAASVIPELAQSPAANGPPEPPVAVLQAVPATPPELAWARVRGAEALQRRWREAGTDLFDLGRGSVALV